MKNLSTDKIITNLASIGIPSLVLITLISLAPCTGGAAISWALVAFGPFGMIGGIVSFGILTLISKLIAEKGIEYLSQEVVKKLLEKGITKEEIINSINKYPLSKGLKVKIIGNISL
jgi:hypothetical protein